MRLDDVMTVSLRPALSLLPEVMTSPEALRILIAIGLQESEFTYRSQIRGPARGFWQFEEVGIEGVLKHPASGEYAQGVCKILDYYADVDDVYPAVQHNDVLAACFARLLLWRLEDPLPVDARNGWNQYTEVWSPGRPRRNLWVDNWSVAREYVSRL